MFMIGIDPHKGSHTAVAVDRDEAVIDTIRVDADRHQRARLLAWAQRSNRAPGRSRAPPGWVRCWPSSSSPPASTSWMCHRSCRPGCGCWRRGRIDKTDPNDARSAAIVAWRNPTLNVVAGLDEHRVVLRLLADRDHQITAQRTRTMCRLHALLCLLIEGGTGRSLTATKAHELLDLVTIDGPITAERVATARQLHRPRSTPSTRPASRPASAPPDDRRPRPRPRSPRSTGSARSPRRSSSAGSATSAGSRPRGTSPATTAPLRSKHHRDRSKRHRLNPRGDRQLNHAIHMAAVTQVGHDTPGRVYYLRKQAEGKTRKEAMRALKRHISDAVYQRLVDDTRH